MYILVFSVLSAENIEQKKQNILPEHKSTNSYMDDIQKYVDTLDINNTELKKLKKLYEKSNVSPRMKMQE